MPAGFAGGVTQRDGAVAGTIGAEEALRVVAESVLSTVGDQGVISRLGLEHEWLRPRLDAKVESRCTVYWRPGMCATSEAVWEGEYPDNFCHRIPRAYRLEPIAETRLPARPGHAENYPSDEVAVGFYRLRKPE